MTAAVLAVDLGSSRFKARVVDRNLRPLSDAATDVANVFGPGGRVEIAPAEVDRAVAEALARALGGAPDARPEAVVVTSQAQTFTVVNETGAPKRPFVSWMDSRARETAAELARLDAFATFAQHASFGAPLAGLTLCVLAHLVRADPTLLSAGDRIAFLPTYVMERLCGVSAVDDNLAAMTGLYSLVLGDWWPAALERCGLRPGQLPRLLAVGSVVGRTTARAEAWGLPAGLPVISAGNDQTAGAYGCELHCDGSLLVTLGTAQVAYCTTPAMPASDPALFRGPYPGGLAYRAAVDEGGGSLVRWAGQVLVGCGEPDGFFALASSAPPGSSGVTFRGGRWEGIGPEIGPGDLARSILEHIVAETAEIVRRVEPEPRGRRVLVAGGGSRQPLWLELLSRELGVHVVRTDADPPLGAARLGRELLGIPRSLQA